MFEKFPKKRTPLPESIQRIYADHYRENREGGSRAASLAQAMESWLHRQVARDVYGTTSDDTTTLEIGAGTLNQLSFEPVVGPYDVIEPFTELYEGSAQLGRIRRVYSDVHQIPEGASYDRITSVAAFEHICDLPHVAARAGVLLAPGARLRVAIPSEGTPLWTLGWKLTTGLEFRLRHGVDYGILMRHEHVNTAKEIREVLEYFFRHVECSVLGLNRFLSLYQYYECSSPDLRLCKSFGR